MCVCTAIRTFARCRHTHTNGNPNPMYVGHYFALKVYIVRVRRTSEQIIRDILIWTLGPVVGHMRHPSFANAKRTKYFVQNWRTIRIITMKEGEKVKNGGI